MQPDPLVAVDVAGAVEIARVEKLAVSVPVRPATRSGRQLELAEVAAKGDVRLVAQAGVTPDRHAPLVLHIDGSAARVLVQRLRQVDSTDFRAKARQEGPDLQLDSHWFSREGQARTMLERTLSMLRICESTMR